MCALGRSCQDLYVCNLKVEVEALLGLNVHLLIDCCGGTSDGGHGRGKGKDRGHGRGKGSNDRCWRDVHSHDEGCAGSQYKQNHACTHTHTHTLLLQLGLSR